LSEITENITLCLDKQGKPEDAIKLFEHVAEIAELPGLRKRFLWMKAIWYDAKLMNRKKAREVLSEIDIRKEDDLEMLQAYLDLFDLSSKDKLQIIDRIIQKARLPSELLHYSTLKALYLHMTGENEQALGVVEDAIANYAIGVKHIPDLYYMNICARAYSFKWRMTGKEEDFAMAISYFNNLIHDDFTEEGKSCVYSEIGAQYSEKGELDDAIKNYELSLKCQETEVAKIHLAECYLKSGDIKKGKDMILGISYDNISEMCKLEFLQVLSILAIKDDDTTMARDICNKLMMLSLQEEYFEHQRNELCATLQKEVGF